MFSLIAAFCCLADFASPVESKRKLVGGGGDRTRPPNYKVPWNEGVAAARQIQLLILLTETEDAGCVAVVQTRKERKR